jgi:hypothetical protein
LFRKLIKLINPAYGTQVIDEVSSFSERGALKFELSVREENGTKSFYIAFSTADSKQYIQLTEQESRYFLDFLQKNIGKVG